MGAGELPFTSAPYPGLRPFAAAESDIFFGREEQVDKLLEKLQQNRFLALVGASGCGKSSLVRAGLIAGLEAGFMGEAGHRWRIADLRPGNEPLLRLAEAVLDPRALGAELAPSTSLAAAHAQLRRGPLGLVEIVREARLPEGTNLLVLVDQFEEIFRFRRLGNANTADAFVALLLETARCRKQPVFVALTMRSDFLGDCAVFRGLPEAISESEFLTPRLTREQIREVIVGPARMFGGDVDPALLNRLINDVGPDPDQLPVLQHALMRMWSRAESRAAEAKEPPLMTLDDYAAIGGLRAALSNHGDEILNGLSVERRRLGKTMFSWLTERGEGRRDTRRPATVCEIAEVARTDPSEVAAVADTFRVPGVSFLTPPHLVSLTADSVLDISHESLIRVWASLAAWVEEEAERASMYVRLKQAAELWKKGGADLWSGRQVTNATVWAQAVKPTAAWAMRYGSREDFDSAMAFLTASKNSWTRRRLFQGALGTLAAAGVIGSAVVYLVLTYNAGQEALSGELAMESRRLLSLDQDRALEQADAAVRAKDTKKALQAAAQVLDARLELARFQPRRNEQVLATGLAGSALAALVLEDSGAARLADLSTGRTIAMLELPEWRPSMAVFSAQGQRLLVVAQAAYGNDRISRIALWDPAAKGGVARSVDYPGSIETIALSPAGERAALAASDGTLAFLEYDGNNGVKRLGKLPPGIRRLAFSPSGEYLLAYIYGARGERARVVVCDLNRATCRSIAPPGTQRDDQLQGAWFGLDDAHVVTVTSRSGLGLSLWKLSGKPREIARADLAMHGIVAGSVDARGEHLALIDQASGSVHVIEVRTGSEVGRFKPPGQGYAIMASFAPDGRSIATKQLDDTTRVWRLPSLQLPAKVGAVRSAALNAKGSRVALGSGDGTIYLLDVQNPEQGFELRTAVPQYVRRSGQRLPNAVHFVGFDPGGERLLAAYEDGYARVWDVRTGKLLLRTRTPHAALVRSASFSPDGSLILTASEDGSVAVWTASDGTKRGERRLPVPEGGDPRFPVGASFDDDERVSVYSNGGEVWAWTLADDQWAPDPRLWLYEPVRVTTGASGSVVVAQHAFDGTEPVVLFRDSGTVRTPKDRTAEGKLQTDRRLPLPGARLVMNFTDDGRLVATVNADRTVTVWSVGLAETKNRSVPRQVTRAGTADFAAISSDGSHLLLVDSGRITVQTCMACRVATKAAHDEVLEKLESAMGSLVEGRRQRDETSDTGVAAARARDGGLG